MTLEKDTVEKTFGNPVTTLTSTAVGAVGGFFMAGPLGAVLGALLPELTGILAQERARKRVDSAIEDLRHICNEHEEKLNKINDAQYKILAETVLTTLQTIEEGKLDYLKRIIRNTISNTEITPHEAALISRIIRDISADEAMFLVNNSHYSEIVIKHYEMDTKEEAVLYIDATDEKISLVNGLVNLGLLLVQPAGLGGGSVNYTFSTIAAKLKKLLKEDH